MIDAPDKARTERRIARVLRDHAMPAREIDDAVHEVVDTFDTMSIKTYQTNAFLRKSSRRKIAAVIEGLVASTAATAAVIATTLAILWQLN
ncbi:hypothetical protein [Marivivens marinus]|uniref:hypothetical protein n=1 Tax=Marivivens marinus TaxID=3110173 RepID=UPI003B84636B